MATLSTQTIETLNSRDIEQLPNKQLVRSFGQSNDSIELKIFDKQGNILLTDKSFREYTTYDDAPGTKGKPRVTSIDIDYEQVLRDYGYNSGTYAMNFSFQRKILEISTNAFTISEISPSRREIRVTPNRINQIDFELALSTLNNILVASPFVRDINLITSDTSVLILNALLSRDKTGLIKLYNPLPANLSVGSSFDIIEEIINPLEVTVKLDPITEEIVGIDIGPPNFTLSTEDIFTVPSGQKTFDQILGSNTSISSSFNTVSNLLSGSGVYLDLEFDNIDTPSGYHFENFIHFSSAAERLQNFKYKLELLESYSSSIANLDNITGAVSSSQFVTENRSILRNKENKLVQGFDFYERYLYYESGAYAWPKTNDTKPFTNVKTTSAAANSWFGVLIDNNGTYNGGQMASASKFDNINQYNLVNTIPPHIRDNSQNDKYILFVEMIGHHFDNIWAYIDSITDINEAYSGLKDGISKDLVLEKLTSRGISAYDQFSNSSIYEYLIGDDGTGAYQFGTDDTATMISASNAGSIPKGDIAKEIWKRLYHNSSYLLKTKGTERGLKALIACYGIPETVLHVKEYGGPLRDKTGFRTFTYQKESKMHTTNNDGESSILKVFNNNFLPDPDDGSSRTKTIQTRFLPTKGSNTSYDIITLNAASGVDKIGIGISQSLDVTKIHSESFAHLVAYSGSQTTIVTKSSSSLGPIFNNKVWNLSVVFDSGSTNQLTAYATQTTFNKNTYVLSCSLDLTTFYENMSEVESTNADYSVGSGEQSVNDSKALLGAFTGSIQEHRVWRELLTKDTIVTQSLSPFNYNGNTVSSSYEALIIRNPLGSNLQDIPTTNDSNNNFAPKKDHRDTFAATVYADATSTFIEETHHLTTPDTVGSGMVSDKVRIDKGTFDDNFLDPFISVETSPQDRQPVDYSDLGVFFSPTFEVNEDIIYTLGGFRLDDYIGDPRDYTSGSYPDLKTIRDIYDQKTKKQLGIGDYVRTIQFFDHTLFKMIKEFVPAKVNLKTGLVIEPHYLERVKVPGTNIDYEQKPEHLAKFIGSGSISSTYEEEVDVVIDVPDYILTGSFGTATENVAQVNRKSRYYSLR